MRMEAVKTRWVSISWPSSGRALTGSSAWSGTDTVSTAAAVYQSTWAVTALPVWVDSDSYTMWAEAADKAGKLLSVAGGGDTVSALNTAGVAQGLYADNDSWNFALPFNFPFYGQSYSSVNLSTNGFLDFVNVSPDPVNSNTVGPPSRNTSVAEVFDSPASLVTVHSSSMIPYWVVKVTSGVSAPAVRTPPLLLGMVQR